MILRLVEVGQRSHENPENPDWMGIVPGNAGTNRLSLTMLQAFAANYTLHKRREVRHDMCVKSPWSSIRAIHKVL